jgi:hypothetical protein
MRNIIITASTLLTALFLQACGGTATEEPAMVQSEHERLRDEAAAKLLQVRALVENTPCTQSSQCSSLTLQPQLPPCFFNERYDYSLISPTANAASAAAADYNSLSERAYALEPASNVSGSCFQNVDVTPLNCVANKCVRQLVFGPGQ